MWPHEVEPWLHFWYPRGSVTLDIVWLHHQIPDPITDAMSSPTPRALWPYSQFLTISREMSNADLDTSEFCKGREETAKRLELLDDSLDVLPAPSWFELG